MKKRNITVERSYKSGTREPRAGELLFDMKQLILKHCSKHPLKRATQAVNAAASQIASRHGVKEFECNYRRVVQTAKGERSWVVEWLVLQMYKSIGKTNVYRAVACSYPRPFRSNVNYADLNAPRDLSISYVINDPYLPETRDRR